jgi:methionyl aminopeptidase
MHEATRAAIRPGVTTMQLNEIAAEVLAKRGARSNFLNYHGFPAVICTSPNDMIVHGIPGNVTLHEGDIISVDCGAIVEGYHGDAAYTAGVGEISDEAKRLIEVTERSLWAGIDQLGRATASTRSAGRSRRSPRRPATPSCASTSATPSAPRCTRAPRCRTTGRARPGPTLKEGMVFAIEPMVNVGTYETYLLDDGWSVMTRRLKLSAHFEHTIAVTDDGPEVFTAA